MGYFTEDRTRPAQLTRRGLATLTLTTALGLALGTSGCSSGADVHQDVPTFTTTVKTTGVKVIDVRTAAEFASGHLEGATNLDVSGAAFQSDLGALDQAGSYALYCHSGKRSAKALTIMQNAGFKHVVDLAGGVQAWTAAGGALVTT